MGKVDEFLVGLAIGALGLAVLSSLLKPKCPNCRTSLNEGTPVCPNCHTIIRWV